MMNLNLKITEVRPLSFALVLFLTLIFMSSAKSLPPSTAITTTVQTLNTQQACDCSAIEYNYTSCMNSLIQTNNSLNVCSNITYPSVVNNINQQINNINNTINHFTIVLELTFGISLFTFLDFEFSIVKKIKKKFIKKEEKRVSISISQSEIKQ